jgi:hypothetical protein
MQRAMQKAFETYTDAELRLLLRFANQGYATMLAATEELKAMIEAPTEKRAGLKKPPQAPR